MTHRLLKELRPLLPAWGVGLLAACATLVWSWETFTNLSAGVFAACMALLAALPFGTEFQQRTFPLLLSQPINRSRVWGEKILLVFALAMTAALVVLWVGNPGDRMVECTFVLVTACSAPFWTLVGRSTIAGAVLSAASEFITAGLAALAFEKIRGREFALENTGDLALTVIVIVGYSALFLWLGWRKFARLELKDAYALEGPALPGAAVQEHGWASWLRCRPQDSGLNLVRKELRLQTPLFWLAGVLAACWLAALAALFIEPAWEQSIGTIFDALTVVQIALIPLLAGCLSQGEEKAIGLTAWHLTLPVSIRRQWLIKLGVGAGLALLLGVVVPGLLAAVTWFKVHAGLMELLLSDHGGSANVVGLLVWTVVPFALSFWAATLVGNTVRAALLTVLAIPALFGCAMLGLWFAHLLDGFETGLLARALAWLQLAPDVPVNLIDSLGAPVIWVLSIVGLGIVLAQSLAQFRRAQSERRALVKYSAILAAFAFIVVLWLGDLVHSAQKVRSFALRSDVLGAVGALSPGSLKLPEIGYTAIPRERLMETGVWSGNTKKWLRNSTIVLQRAGWYDKVLHHPASERIRQYWVLVRFPGSEWYCGGMPETSFRRAAPRPASPLHPAASTPTNR